MALKWGQEGEKIPKRLLRKKVSKNLIKLLSVLFFVLEAGFYKKLEKLLKGECSNYSSK